MTNVANVQLINGNSVRTKRKLLAVVWLICSLRAGVEWKNTSHCNTTTQQLRVDRVFVVQRERQRGNSWSKWSRHVIFRRISMFNFYAHHIDILKTGAKVSRLHLVLQCNDAYSFKCSYVQPLILCGALNWIFERGRRESDTVLGFDEMPSNSILSDAVVCTNTEHLL